jgi:hypothetical protein
VKFFEFSCDITNLSKLNVGNEIYINVIQTWELINTTKLLLKYFKIDIISKSAYLYKSGNSSHASWGIYHYTSQNN